MSKNLKRVKDEPENIANQVDIIAFWRPTDPHNYLGQWYTAKFTLTNEMCDNLPIQLKNLTLFRERPDVLRKLARDQTTFNTAERFMMQGKAALFRDDDIFDKMSRTDSAREHKSLGRKVDNFDETEWTKYCRDIVKVGNYFKFTQNNDIKDRLLETDDALLVEGSPVDKIWGVGIQFDHPHINNIAKWKGKNYLGECLMFVRTVLQQEDKKNGLSC